MLLKILAVLWVALVSVSGYSSGPPVDRDGVCSDMMPQHDGLPAQTGAPYFEISVNSECYAAGQEIQVQIKSICDTPGHIKGVFLQARSNDGEVATNEAIGEFNVTDPILDVLSCFDGTNNAVGHNAQEAADVRSATWIAPANQLTDIVMYATVVHMKEKFWVGLKSSVISHLDNCTEAQPVELHTCGAATLFPLMHILALATLTWLFA